MPFDETSLYSFLEANPDGFIDACRYFERGVTPSFRKRIAQVMFPELSEGHGMLLLDAYDICSLLGDLGFCFPEWRFPTMKGPKGVSLLEGYGFEKLRRTTDLLDDSLPDPSRDLFGTGYRRYGSADGNYTELRRAYMVRSTANMTVLVRNSSFYFGRDRLPYCAYFSTEHFSCDELQGITLDKIVDSSRFIPITRIFSDIVGIDEQQKAVFNVILALLDLVRLRRNFGNWLLTPGGGLGHFRNFLVDRVSKDLALPYLGLVNQETTHEIGRAAFLKQIDDNVLSLFDDAIRARSSFCEVGQKIFRPNGFLGDLVLMTNIKGDRPVMSDL